MTDDSIPEWDISPLVRSELPGAIREEMNSYVKAAEDFESSYIGKIEFLNDKQLMNAFEELERFMWGANRVRNYCWMNADVNTDDSGVKELVEFGHSGYSKVKSVYAIFEIEITKLLTKNSSIIESQELKPYQYHLSRMREKSIHLLSEEEEKLILEMNLHGRQAWTALHTEFLGSSTRRVVLDNEEREYSLMELAVIPQNSTNRENRRVAMESCHSLLAENRILLSHAYRAICSSYVSEMNKRKWPNVLAYALHEEDIDLSSVLAMQNVLKKNSQLLRKYLSLKASILNIDRLGYWDLKAPIEKTENRYSWMEARKMVTEAFTQFDYEIGKWVDDLFEKKRIDAKSRQGKIGFGSCWFSYKPNSSWIVLNFAGSLGDVFTLAHEVGHGLHSFLSSEANSFLNWAPGKCMSETASIFGELLLFDSLISNAIDDEKLVILCRLLDRFRSTVYNSSMNFEFEKRTYDAIQNERFLDAENLANLWMDCINQTYGDIVEWTPNSKWGWAFASHNFRSDTRFYNFPYTFGQLLVYALYQMYKDDGSLFVPKMKKILQTGGSVSPDEVLREVGFDISSESFWETGIRYANSLVNQLENLLEGRES